VLIPLVPGSGAPPVRVAIIGAGFIARGLVHRLARRPTMAPPILLSRRLGPALEILSRAGYGQSGSVTTSQDPRVLSEAVAAGRPAVTTDPDVLPEVSGIDVVVEATGAVDHGTRVMLDALRAGRHVVSMNAEADALLGHHLDAVAAAHGATYSIADGDQPGVLLRMMDETRHLGLDIAVALNCKRNLDVHQTRAHSRPYAERDGTSVEMTTSFGDGTKMHIENVVTANRSGLTVPPFGTPGVETNLERAASDVHEAGIASGTVHFTLGGDFGGGVLILARSGDPDFDAPRLRMLKMGDGPWYPLFRPYHLTFMEVPVTIEQLAAGGPALGQRVRTPTAVCVTIAKRDVAAGTELDGIGGDLCYGMAAAAEEGAELLPIGLAEHATLRRDVPQDEPISLDDVELDEDAFIVQLVRAAASSASGQEGAPDEASGPQREERPV